MASIVRVLPSFRRHVCAMQRSVCRPIYDISTSYVVARHFADPTLAFCPDTSVAFSSSFASPWSKSQCRTMATVLENKFPQADLFRIRHIGPNEAEKNEMLRSLGYEVGKNSFKIS